MLSSAAGVFISADGHFLTNYHVVREEILAAGRDLGASEPLLCRFTSFEIPVIINDAILSWRPLKQVTLLQNVSATEWGEGIDVALLQAADPPQAFLPLSSAALRLGAPIWHFGFPFRTCRAAERLQSCGYRDADGSLRVSTGTVTEVRPYNFISNADSFSGNSGGPALNADGEVVGLVWNVFPDTELDRRAHRFKGGTIYVSALQAAERFGLS